MAENVVELRDISKRFGDVQANDGIDFDLRAGEIHVLLGENGAGKTTLMNVMFGHVLPDSGTMLVGGRPADIRSPHDALALGIGMVHQHFSLVPTFTAAENIVLGSRPVLDLRLKPSAIRREIASLADRYNMPISPATPVRDLPVDLQQRVEILKVLYRGAKILILDEPTSLLGPRQIDNLLGILEDLRADGHSIVLVTHKLAEVMQAADRVTVIRAGKKVTEVERGEFNERTLTRAMTGQDITTVKVDRVSPQDEAAALLQVNNLVTTGIGVNSLDGLNLSVRAGEILGVAGVEGNGQRDIVNAVTGLASLESGTVRIDGVNVTGSEPGDLREHGLAVIPEDRHGWGLVLDMTLAENLAINEIPAGGFTRRGLLDWKRIKKEAAGLLEEYDVRPADTELEAGTLSGGNQQKVVLAREFSRRPKVLIADNPTWGLDVGAVDYVHRRLLQLKEAGTAVLLMSLDLDELLKLSDRVAVMYRGRVVLERPVDELDLDDLALAMAGSPVGVA
ncbi:ABC transporter ATP-binding protein [Candidatus Poriferisocius sp.]|uniref:ABC transporter ATP-binding protein n=1 Tax=Candidatus Poriferisocius sp. TaxID=3101276 RepID=UPI003B5CA583